MKVIVKTIFGSHLYGTNTETSDIDYKVIYQSSLQDIILNKQRDVKREVADDHKEETEYIELRKFLKDLANGQTYAIDMVFTLKDKIVYKNLEWDLIVENKKYFLSKDCKSFIGYCITQANLYANKGKRINTLRRIINDIDSLAIGNPKETTIRGLFNIPTITKTFVKNGRNVSETYLEIFGKYYVDTITVHRFREQIVTALEGYGRRSNLASEIKDWKSIYHAFRTIRELKELATTGAIRFPLSCADELLEIRKGKWLDYKPERLEWEVNSVLADVRASNLQDNIDQEWLDKFICSFYI